MVLNTESLKLSLNKMGEKTKKHHPSSHPQPQLYFMLCASAS